MIFYALLPRRCLVCGEPSPWSQLCRPCRARYLSAGGGPSETGRCPVCGQVLLAESHRCMDCGETPWTFPSVDGFFGYQEAEGELLRLYKFAGEAGLADLWARAAVSRLVPRGPLVPVPPHRRHRLRRGWDPVDHLVRALARQAGLPVWPSLVRRSSVSQKTLDRGRRGENALRSYALAPKAEQRLGGTPLVWLIDDVVTTGATVEACARLLKSAGVGEVRVFCLGLH